MHPELFQRVRIQLNAQTRLIGQSQQAIRIGAKRRFDQVVNIG